MIFLLAARRFATKENAGAVIEPRRRSHFATTDRYQKRVDPRKPTEVRSSR